jgi:glucuronoarabinoxylan endo-1,4-beta-xylanase
MVVLPALAPLLARADPAQQLRLDLSRKFQVIEGFGTSLNTWHADVAAAYQREDFQNLYLNTLGATALRLNLWAGVSTVIRERWQDIDGRNFRFEGPGAQGQTTVRVARRLHTASRGKLRIIATSWSPPAWMKVNESITNGHPARKSMGLNLDSAIERGSWNGPAPDDMAGERYRYIGRNKLRRDRYHHFAKYLVEWVRYYRSLGIELYAISPANEPRFSHWFDSCVYTPSEYAELMEVIRWMFADQSELAMSVFGPEHMAWDVAGNRAYLDALARRSGTRGSLAAIAAHGYTDGFTSDLRRESTAAFARLAAQHGDRTWITEGGFGGHDWPAPLHQLATAFLHALRDGGVSLLTPWQALTRQPDEHGLMSLQGPTKKTYVAMHFWRFIRPGMVRVALETGRQLDAVAFEDVTTKTTIVVILNRQRTAVSASLQVQGEHHVEIDTLYITDASRNCKKKSEGLALRSLVIPPEALVTVILKSR